SKLNFEKNSFGKSEIPFIHVPTLTALFRNKLNLLPEKMRDNLIDGSLFLFLSQFGSFYYLNEKTAMYRIHDGGTFSGSSELVNSTRSVSVRLAAWKYLPNIDRLA